MIKPSAILILFYTRTHTGGESHECEECGKAIRYSCSPPVPERTQIGGNSHVCKNVLKPSDVLVPFIENSYRREALLKLGMWKNIQCSQFLRDMKKFTRKKTPIIKVIKPLHVLGLYKTWKGYSGEKVSECRICKYFTCSGTICRHERTLDENPMNVHRIGMPSFLS